MTNFKQIEENLKKEAKRLLETGSVAVVLAYTKAIDERIIRIKDLMIPFQKKHIYLPEMRGRYSIKYILPALVPGLSYDNLEIRNGGIAMNAYEELQYETDMDKVSNVIKNLLEYCSMDTLAMVKILQKLEEITSKK